MINRAAAAMAALLAAGCAVIPAPRAPLTPSPVTPTILPPQSSPSRSDVPETARPSNPLATADAGACTVSFVLDDVGHGGTFSGTGFAPDVPVTMTFTTDTAPPQVVDETNFPQLHTDVRGAWQLHLFADRENIGEALLSVSDGSCVAEKLIVTPAERFPEAECIPADEPASSGSADSDAYSELVGENEPISYWRFEEEMGLSTESDQGETADLIEPAHLGEPGFIEGSRSMLLVEVIGPSSGTDIGGWLDIPDLELEGDFTIEAWLRFCGGFVWFQDGLVGQAGDGPDVNFDQWRARMWSDNSEVVVSDEVIQLHGWHHLAITRSGTDVALYEDGQLNDTGSFDGVFPIKAVGYGHDGTFGGWLDEVAIYDRALTAEEVAAHAAFGE